MDGNRIAFQLLCSLDSFVDSSPCSDSKESECGIGNSHAKTNAEGSQQGKAGKVVEQAEKDDQGDRRAGDDSGYQRKPKQLFPTGVHIRRGVLATVNPLSNGDENQKASGESDKDVAGLFDVDSAGVKNREQRGFSNAVENEQKNNR